MTTSRLTRIFACTMVISTFVAVPAVAQTTVEGGATIVGPNGKVTEVRRSATGQNGSASGSASVQREDERGWIRDWDRTRENGSVRRNGTLTTNSGRTWTRQGERNCGGGVCLNNSVVAGPNGRTYSRDAQWQRTGRGQWEGTVTRTGPRGRSTTSRRWFQIKRNR